MNTEAARFNMIEQQIRTWDVLDQNVLQLLARVKREEFVPQAYRGLAFVDMDIPLPGGENMFPPKQELAVKPEDVILEIGAGSGYMAALLAHQGSRVTSVEIQPELCALARSHLARAGIENVSVVEGDGATGWTSVGEVDVIMVSGSLPFVPQSLLAQLRMGGRLAVIVGDAPVMTAEIWTRTTPHSCETVKLFETAQKSLRHALQPSRFTF